MRFGRTSYFRIYTPSFRRSGGVTAESLERSSRTAHLLVFAGLALTISTRNPNHKHGGVLRLNSRPDCTARTTESTLPMSLQTPFYRSCIRICPTIHISSSTVQKGEQTVQACENGQCNNYPFAGGFPLRLSSVDSPIQTGNKWCCNLFNALSPEMVRGMLGFVPDSPRAPAVSLLVPFG